MTLRAQPAARRRAQPSCAAKRASRAGRAHAADAKVAGCAHLLTISGGCVGAASGIPARRDRRGVARACDDAKHTAEHQRALISGGSVGGIACGAATLLRVCTLQAWKAHMRGTYWALQCELMCMCVHSRCHVCPALDAAAPALLPRLRQMMVLTSWAEHVITAAWFDSGP
jgi:hypothetical protein